MTFPVTKWSIEHSPALSLELLGINGNGLSKEEQRDLLRQHLSLCPNLHSQIEKLSHEIATRRSQTCGESFAEVYQDCLAYYSRECDAVIHPQMS
jgi:hypothetical protein